MIAFVYIKLTMNPAGKLRFFSLYTIKILPIRYTLSEVHIRRSKS